LALYELAGQLSNPVAVVATCVDSMGEAEKAALCCGTGVDCWTLICGLAKSNEAFMKGFDALGSRASWGLKVVCCDSR